MTNMGKHKTKKSKGGSYGCSSHATIAGKQIVVKAACPCKKGTGAKTDVKTTSKHRKAIPKECHGVQKYEKRNCIKMACANRVTPALEKACLKRARVKA